MFGVRGLSGIGLVHVVFALAALASGLGVISFRKGTRRHRRVGRLYVAAMLLLNVTALLIYRLYGGFGPFHVAALISLATVLAGVRPALKRGPGWVDQHATFMAWSYVGLLAAFVAEIAVRVPGARFGPAVILASALIIGGGAIAIHTRVPVIVSRLTGLSPRRRSA